MHCAAEILVLLSPSKVSQGLPLYWGLCALKNVTSDISISVQAAFDIVKCLELELVDEESLRMMSPSVVHISLREKAI